MYEYSRLNQLVQYLIFSWVIVGALTIVAGLLGLFYWPLSLLLLLPSYFLSKIIKQMIVDWTTVDLSVQEQLLCLALILTLCSHLVGVFLPEIGFDALWYHLPTLEEYSFQHRLIYDTRWYQILYPQFGDMLLFLGFQIGGVFGAKLVAYLTTLSLLVICYHWLREKTNLSWATGITTVIALFQVIGWQAASAYVDVINALFLIAGIWLLEQYRQPRNTRNIVIAGLSFGAFLSVKYINLTMIPVLVLLLSWYAWRTKFSYKRSFLWAKISMFVLPLFWYVRAWWYTGNMLYPRGTEFAKPVIEQMEKGGWAGWLLFRLETIYLLPFEFFFKNDGYTTLLIPIFVLILLWFWKKGTVKFDETNVFLILLFGSYGLLFWWFFPPPSTRYVLGQIIIAFILLSITIHKNIHPFTRLKTFLMLLIFVSICGHLAIRLYVNSRAIPYVLGFENQQQYLDRFRNGFLDEKIDGFYGKK